jgi:hypothetical protein
MITRHAGVIGALGSNIKMSPFQSRTLKQPRGTFDVAAIPKPLAIPGVHHGQAICGQISKSIVNAGPAPGRMSGKLTLSATPLVCLSACKGAGCGGSAAVRLHRQA